MKQYSAHPKGLPHRDVLEALLPATDVRNHLQVLESLRSLPVYQSTMSELGNVMERSLLYAKKRSPEAMSIVTEAFEQAVLVALESRVQHRNTSTQSIAEEALQGAAVLRGKIKNRLIEAKIDNPNASDHQEGVAYRTVSYLTPILDAIYFTRPLAWNEQDVLARINGQMKGAGINSAQRTEARKTVRRVSRLAIDLFREGELPFAYTAEVIGKINNPETWSSARTVGEYVSEASKLIAHLIAFIKGRGSLDAMPGAPRSQTIWPNLNCHGVASG